MDIGEDFVQNIGNQRTINFLKKGYDFVKLGKYHEAKMCFENATNSNKKNIDAWLNFGITTFILNNNGAIQLFENSFKYSVGKREYINQRFKILCNTYYKNDPKLPDVKRDFEIAKSNLEMRTVGQSLSRSLESLIKNLIESPVLSKGPKKQPQYDPFFPSELVQDYPEHEFYSEGGNSRVYKSKRKTDELIVAIKIPREFDRKRSKEFIDEIAIWRDLDHKNIVKIVDYSANPAYIVMEYFPQSLRDWDKPMSPNDALKMITKLSDALSYAHKKGRIHTDIKPGNILLSKENEPKLADWGLGRISGLSQSRLISQTSYTLLYAAPEQLRNESPSVQTDIWQIGVVLYELITGKNPFDAEDPELTYKKIKSEDPVDPPSTHNPNLKRLDNILMKCLQKKHNNRYRSVDELSHDIDKVLIDDFTMKTTNKSPYVKLNGHFELIRMHCQKKNYDEVISHLTEIQNLSQDENVRNMITNKIEAIKTYRSLRKTLDDQLLDIEKIFKRYLETHILETS